MAVHRRHAQAWVVILSGSIVETLGFSPEDTKPSSGSTVSARAPQALVPKRMGGSPMHTDLTTELTPKPAQP